MKSSRYARFSTSKGNLFRDLATLCKVRVASPEYCATVLPAIANVLETEAQRLDDKRALHIGVWVGYIGFIVYGSIFLVP